MRVFLAATLLVPQLAAADLYRWVDPQTGSVKFSSTPPPWYETERGPKVERIPYKGPATGPATGPAAKPPGADKPAAVGGVDPGGKDRRRAEQPDLSQKAQK